MRAQVQRARGLLHRYRIDRRLPPQTKDLYLRTIRLQAAEVAERTRAENRRTLGVESDGPPARLGSRRLITAGPLNQPTSELAVSTAQRVCEVLTQAGLRPFAVERSTDQIVLGLELDDRGKARDALVALGAEPGWYLEWHGGGSSGIVPLTAARRTRKVARARSLVVFRAYRVGARATGPELGVMLTFWVPGPSGQLERVGVRGQDRFDSRSQWTTVDIDGRSFPGRSAFPIDNSLERFDKPIDIVFTWVDSSDPTWQQAFRATAEAHGRRLDEASLDPARFTSRDELRYALRAVWMYCGWVDNIYVVTAGQRPPWLVDHPHLHVVDHADIFPESALPTFNSHSIEATLHRIAGLNEHFIYFNDDMLVTRPLRPEDFFHPNGLPYWFPSDARVPGVEHDETQAVDTAAIRGRELLQRHFGRITPYKPLHSPYPLLRSVLDEIESRFPDVIDRTRHSRFRSPGDLSVAASFGQHYAFATGRAIAGNIESEYVHVESGRLDRHLDRIRLDRTIATCCINETEYDAHRTDEQEATIHRFFSEQYPIPAPWEGPSGEN